MKFGAVDLAEAEGAILAHSVTLSDGGRLRKGLLLSPRDVDALRESGLVSVTVARLEDGDVLEDQAALALAQALVPDPGAQGLDLTRPFTGRVNLLAQAAGVVEMDLDAIEAVNRVHPMITIATVPAWHQMQAGGMVATIKIISYAVPEAALRRACDAARSALRVRGPAIESVRLVVSEIPGGAGDKGWKAIAARVAAFGLTLAAPVCVPHRVDTLAAALREDDPDLTLILTGSATSDIADVAPTAVRAAGGTVTRFGMPVDPGNLLFLGTLGTGAVIGLPGCARSPALNGADWVMSRLVCGVQVTDADIAGMGVGGLLKEIPTRPQPRRGDRASGDARKASASLAGRSK
jgi:molybdenum cofactor cytidylyltransferase